MRKALRKAQLKPQLMVLEISHKSAKRYKKPQTISIGGSRVRVTTRQDIRRLWREMESA